MARRQAINCKNWRLCYGKICVLVVLSKRYSPHLLAQWHYADTSEEAPPLCVVKGSAGNSVCLNIGRTARSKVLDRMLSGYRKSSAAATQVAICLSTGAGSLPQIKYRRGTQVPRQLAVHFHSRLRLGPNRSDARLRGQEKCSAASRCLISWRPRPKSRPSRRGTLVTPRLGSVSSTVST